MKRREFIKKTLVIGIACQLPWFVSCQADHSQQISIPENEILSPEHRNIVLFFLKHFFPDVEGSPSIEKLNTYYHINNYLSDPNIDPDEQQYLKNGIKWVNETAVDNFNKKFNLLTLQEKETLIKKVLNTNWGTSWSSRLLTLTFESLLLDPLYYVNQNEAGWKWLHHQPGTPRPTPKNSYTQLLARKKEDLIVTDLSQL